MKQLQTIILALAVAIAFSACKGNGGFTKLRPGIEYRIFNTGKGETIKENQYVMMHIVQKIGDSVLMSTYKQNHNEPILNKIQKAPGNVSIDPFDVFMKLKVGDSAVIRFNQDSVLGKQKPSFVKKTDQVLLCVKITEILSKQKADSIEQQQMQAMAEQQKAMAEQQKEMSKLAAKQKPVDDKLLTSYIAQNHPTATKTSSGLYYVINTPGTGTKCENGKTITMNYTGTLLDGTKFDSNVDPAFNHVEPFKFSLGMGQVIPGWDESIALLKKGEKATLIIPSYLAYGPAGSGKIPANACLKFDVEVVEVN